MFNAIFGVIVFVLIIILVCNKETFKKEYGEIIQHTKDIIGDTNDFKGSNYKRYVNAGVSIVKGKMEDPLLDILDKKFGGSFDHITYRTLKAKIKRLEELHGKGSLISRVLKRDPDLDILNSAFDPDILELCLYDQQVEILNSLVLRDEDPILFMPFINEEILRESIIERMDELYIQGVKGFRSTHGRREDDIEDLQIKNEVIRVIKGEYAHEDQTFLKGLIREIL